MFVAVLSQLRGELGMGQQIADLISASFDGMNQHTGQLVDDLVGKQEVVIKSLGETFKDVLGVAGCAILGDGKVGLILDIDGIAQGRA